MNNLDTIQVHINSLSLEEWKKLFDLIPEIETVMRLSDKERQASKTNSHAVKKLFVGIIDKFYQTMYDLDLVIEYDWAHWDEGERIVAENDFSGKDLVTLLKILTALIRADRFSDDLLESKFEDGTILGVLMELQNSCYSGY